MPLAQIGRRRRVDGRGFKQIDQRFTGTERYHVISGLGFTLTLQRQTKAFRIKALHCRKLLGYQRNVVNAFIGKHVSSCRFAPNRLSTFFGPEPVSAPVERGSASRLRLYPRLCRFAPKRSSSFLSLNLSRNVTLFMSLTL